MKIRQFYLTFPIRDSLRPELTWSHYRHLISVENEQARLWYMNEAIIDTLILLHYSMQIATHKVADNGDEPVAHDVSIAETMS